MQAKSLERTGGWNEELDDLADRLQPALNRAQALSRLDQLFADSSAPDEAPDGKWRGRFIATSIAGPIDGASGRIASLWMPWIGKVFDPPANRGINLFAPSFAAVIRLAWPKNAFDRAEKVIKTFPFQTSQGFGAVDPNTSVIKIDYNLEENPRFLVKNILDELVELDERTLLGKSLFRTKARHVPIAYFALRR